MCGIVGYIGGDQAVPVLLNGLSKLEYRGYDSAGIAVRDGENAPVTVKEKGRISGLKEKIGPVESITGNCGIGHTRWATHGKASDLNAHPQTDARGRIAIVHNGIIENYVELILRECLRVALCRTRIFCYNRIQLFCYRNRPVLRKPVGCRRAYRVPDIR